MRALVVDDSRAMRLILGKMLGEMGFEVSGAEHGADALERLRTGGRVDLALVDWNMPVMNGLEFVKAVRADAQHGAMRIVMVTTESEASMIAEAIQAGAHEYVMKPFTKEALMHKVVALGLAA